MAILHETAVSNDGYDTVLPAFTESQYHLYRLALGCLATQLEKTNGDIELAGIMEPGPDAESDRIITISELLTI